MKCNMKRNVITMLGLYSAFMASAASAAPPPASITDLAGEIDAVVLYSVSNNQRYMGIFFKNGATGKKTSCINADSSVTVTTESPYVDTDQFKQMHATALAAQASGKKIGLGIGANCQPHTIWMM